MIKGFKNDESENIFNGRKTKRALKVLPTSMWRIAGRKLDQLDSALELDELKIPPGNRLEALKGNRKGSFSIRINNQYRISFTWSDSGPDEVEIIDYH